MNIGDLVVHLPTGRLVGIKQLPKGSELVLVNWPLTNAHTGLNEEQSEAVIWNELRYATDAEKAALMGSVVATPTAPAVSLPAGADTSAAPGHDTEPSAAPGPKRKKA